MNRRFRPADPDTVPGLIADQLHRVDYDGAALRVALDGPPCSQPFDLAREFCVALRSLGRETVIIAADTFWRDASTRLEFGHHDIESFLRWLDTGALRREVLDPLGAGGSGWFLPSLRDPATNRATRENARRAASGTVVVVTGACLLGQGLPFDHAIHLAMSSPARARRTPAELAWTLAAFETYDANVAPSQIADIVIRCDDRRHPAIG